MKGVFAATRNRVEILEIPAPQPGPHEALVRMRACGICNNTDWKLIEGEFFSGTFPILLGHESVGEVIALGAEVRSFRLGDRVLRAGLRDQHVPLPGGRSCWGGFAEQAIVTDVWAEKGVEYNSFPHPQQLVPPHISPVHAVAMITLKETISCLRNSEVGPGQSLALIGTGPVAQALTVFAKLSGIDPVVVFGRRSEWGELFERLGADAYVAGGDAPREVEAILRDGGFDRAIEAAGGRSALSRCLQVVKPEGRVNLYGIAPESEPYLPAEESDSRVHRSHVAEAEAHDELLGWIDRGEIRLADWISHEMPWTDYQRGLDMVRDKQANKVALLFP